jgi:hypothetical protein
MNLMFPPSKESEIVTVESALESALVGIVLMLLIDPMRYPRGGLLRDRTKAVEGHRDSTRQEEEEKKSDL